MPRKDYSRLVKKYVTNKNGRRVSVWVKRGASKPFKYVVTNKGKKLGFNDMDKLKAWAKKEGIEKVSAQKVTDTGKSEVIKVEVPKAKE